MADGRWPLTLLPTCICAVNLSDILLSIGYNHSLCLRLCFFCLFYVEHGTEVATTGDRVDKSTIYADVTLIHCVRIEDAKSDWWILKFYKNTENKMLLIRIWKHQYSFTSHQMQFIPQSKDTSWMSCLEWLRGKHVIAWLVTFSKKKEQRCLSLALLSLTPTTIAMSESTFVSKWSDRYRGVSMYVSFPEEN